MGHMTAVGACIGLSLGVLLTSAAPPSPPPKPTIPPCWMAAKKSGIPSRSEFEASTIKVSKEPLRFHRSLPFPRTFDGTDSELTVRVPPGRVMVNCLVHSKGDQNLHQEMHELIFED